MNKKDNKRSVISKNELLEIKKQIKKIHESNSSEVPKFLDSLKKRFNVKTREATSDNEFLKYM